jgi:hypothetical protein
MLEDFLPVVVERFGGLVTYWPPDTLPNGVSPDCRNVRFTASTVCTREGVSRVFGTGSPQAVTGLAGYVRLDGTQFPVVFDGAGGFWAETPAGAGSLVPVRPATGVSLPENSFLQTASAYNHLYLSFGDGRTGTAAPASFDGTHLDPLGLAAPAGSANVADSAEAGNVAAGLRYGMVMFKTRSGYITAPQGPFSWTAAGGKQVTVTNLPIGPEQVVARIVAFTVAGGSNAGPFFFIGAPATIDGVSETSTIVEDNITTTATFNFDDVFLAASTDCTAALRKILLPPQAGVWYSPTTRRLIWWGDGSQPSLLRLSEPDDPETVLGDTGLISVAENNGQRITACFEYHGQLYAAKEHSLHLITSNNGDPATWAVQEIVQKIGVCGPRAVDVCGEFIFFAHRSGAHVYDGGDPVPVSMEIQPLWHRINWEYGHLIWVHIDTETRQVRIGVPLDESTVPNVILKVDYQEDWDPPVALSRLSSNEHAAPGRKWSIDDLPAFSALRMERALTAAEGGIGDTMGEIDNRLSTSQVLLASSTADGMVNAIDPNATSDNGQPIHSWYQTAYLSSTQDSTGTSIGVQDLGGVTGSLDGQGLVQLEALPNRQNRPPHSLRTLLLSPEAPGDFTVNCRLQSERIALRISNGNQLDGQFQIRRLFAWMRTSWQTGR